MLNLTIQTDRDFTPVGKRSAKVVTHDRGTKRIRWYVGGRRYHVLPVTPENAALTRDWVANAGASDNLPQAWAEMAA